MPKNKPHGVGWGGVGWGGWGWVVIVVTCVPLDATLLYVGVGWGGVGWVGWGVITFMSCACLWMLRCGTLVEATLIAVTCVPLDATLLYVGGCYINCCNLRANLMLLCCTLVDATLL